MVFEGRPPGSGVGDPPGDALLVGIDFTLEVPAPYGEPDTLPFHDLCIVAQHEMGCEIVVHQGYAGRVRVAGPVAVLVDQGCRHGGAVRHVAPVVVYLHRKGGRGRVLSERHLLLEGRAVVAKRHPENVVEAADHLRVVDPHLHGQLIRGVAGAGQRKGDVLALALSYVIFDDGLLVRGDGHVRYRVEDADLCDCGALPLVLAVAGFQKLRLEEVVRPLVRIVLDGVHHQDGRT